MDPEIIDVHEIVQNAINTPKKEPKPRGRKKKYPEGYNNHFFPRTFIDRTELKRLQEVEKKYEALKNQVKENNLQI